MKKGEKVVILIGLWVFIRRFPQVVSPNKHFEMELKQPY